MRRTIRWLAALMPLLVVVWVSNARAGDLDDLVGDATGTIGHFTADPEMDWFREHMSEAKGVLVVPRLLKGGFVFGGSGGSGVLLARDSETGAWSYPAFYTIGSLTVGAQIGGEAAEIVLLILTQRGMDSMLVTSVKLGADVEVAAGPVGIGTKAATVDVLAFSRTLPVRRSRVRSSPRVTAGTKSTIRDPCVRSKSWWSAR